MLIADLDNAVITSASATQIVFSTSTNFAGTSVLTGTGLSTTVINGGTVNGIDVFEAGLRLYNFTNLALGGTALPWSLRVSDSR